MQYHTCVVVFGFVCSWYVLPWYFTIISGAGVVRFVTSVLLCMNRKCPSYRECHFSVLLNVIGVISDGVDLLGMSEDFTADGKKVEPPVKKVTPEEFLGPNAKLVDFDDLVSKPMPASQFFCYLLTLPVTSCVKKVGGAESYNFRTDYCKFLRGHYGC